MSMKKILLIRPPRYLWPFINESDNFLLPLGLPCIAAAIRKNHPDIEVKIVDCPPLKIGWHTLARIIREEKPDMIGAGEEALYHHEALKLFRLAKEIDPAILTVGGGHFFSWMVESSLKNPDLDIIVRFEGEQTIVELVEELQNRRDLASVKGIAFQKDGSVVTTPLRPLIEDLDSLRCRRTILCLWESILLSGISGR